MKKDKQMKDTKTTGQVFTPKWIVRKILDMCMYNGTGILGKHLMDNSCGDGAFLTSAVRRYCSAFFIKNEKSAESYEKLRKDLGTYIHGMDIDGDAIAECIDNLNKEAAQNGVYGVDWDVRRCDALTERKYDCRMDFIVGNPPYVRVHNLRDSYRDMRDEFSFMKSGMTDLYLAFFEIGFAMMTPTGVMCYITPSSWFMSKAARELRDYIKRSRTLRTIIDFGHEQVFENATTYAAISLFVHNSHSDTFRFYKADRNEENVMTESHRFKILRFDKAFTEAGLILGDSDTVDRVSSIINSSAKGNVQVKNGFATLCDHVFIGDDVPMSDFTIDIVKASTGKWTSCLFPYYCDGQLVPEDELFQWDEVRDYLESHKAELLDRRNDSPVWYGFGRTQGIKDICKKKIALNCIIRDIDDIKMESVDEGEGVYSGLYILGLSMEEARDILLKQEFVDYVKSLRKYKRGGYYTFNSRDVEKYILSKLA